MYLREGWSWVKGPHIRTAPITGQWHCHYCTLQEGWSWVKGLFTLEQLHSEANDTVIIVPYRRGGPESRGLTLEQLQSQANDIVIIIPYRRGSPESRGLTLEQLHSEANDTVIIVPYRRGGPVYIRTAPLRGQWHCHYCHPILSGESVWPKATCSLR